MGFFRFSILSRLCKNEAHSQQLNAACISFIRTLFKKMHWNTNFFFFTIFDNCLLTQIHRALLRTKKTTFAIKREQAFIDMGGYWEQSMC